MAYTIVESQVRSHEGFCKAHNDVHDAQAAYEQDFYNIMRYNYGRTFPYETRLASLPAIRAPPAVHLEQRSVSVDEGDQPKGIDTKGFTRIAQHDAFTKLKGKEPDRTHGGTRNPLVQDDTIHSSRELKRMGRENDIQRHQDLAPGHKIALQITAIPSTIRSIPHGLPSSPWPELHQPTATTGSGRRNSSLPRNDNLNNTKVHGSTYGFFSGTGRRLSSALRDRRNSIDDELGNHRRNHSAPSSTPIFASIAVLKTVKVTCGDTSLDLSISPTTTAMELLAMASEQQGQGFDKKRYVLVESVKEVGSERPVRYYERVRDVLNSWNNDEDNNSLLIQRLHTQWEYESVDLHNGPKIIPSDMTTSLYYSHRPESWHKRNFTMQGDGQILMQKFKEGESKAVCRMSDFDIYTPTARQMKKLAPPKKYCFAIKSQQNPSLAENTSNYIHFFCTGDKDVASEWYRAVHSWRSHHLLHTTGPSQEPSASLSSSKQPPPPPTNSTPRTPRTPFPPYLKKHPLPPSTGPIWRFNPFTGLPLTPSTPSLLPPVLPQYTPTQSPRKGRRTPLGRDGEMERVRPSGMTVDTTAELGVW